MNRNIIIIFYIILFFSNTSLIAYDKDTRVYTIMPVGDSITEGTTSSFSYIYPLWEELYKTGMYFKFIGPRSTETRIGALKHCAFSGKTAEYIDSIIDSVYREYPADIVLLHAGHNHFSSESPVKSIMQSYKSIVKKITEINPEVKFVISKIIPSGKLPKYSYIEELNDSIEKFVSDIYTENIVMADPFKDFNIDIYTIKDKVHPNIDGANHIANAFKEAIVKIVKNNNKPLEPEKITYKFLGNGDSLQLHVFGLNDTISQRPCILYFFGGGWSKGTPLQFYKECNYYASKGIVAISAEYRISSVHNSDSFQSLKDASDAILWIKANSKSLGINQNKIAVAGASAGGQLAAALGTSVMKKLKNVCRPDIMLLYYPVIDNSPAGYGTEKMKERYKEISPLHNITENTPPSLLILGTNDHLIPVRTCEEFKYELSKKNVYCELHLFEGCIHPIFNYREPLDSDFYKVRYLTDNFLRKYGYLK